MNKITIKAVSSMLASHLITNFVNKMVSASMLNRDLGKNPIEMLHYACKYVNAKKNTKAAINMIMGVPIFTKMAGKVQNCLEVRKIVTISVADCCMSVY